jgi:hypothetical protein
MTSPIQLAQTGTTRSPIVTGHPRNRRTACSRAISEKSIAVTNAKVRYVMSHLDGTENCARHDFGLLAAAVRVGLAHRRISLALGAIAAFPARLL